MAKKRNGKYLYIVNGQNQLLFNKIIVFDYTNEYLHTIAIMTPTHKHDNN